LLERAVGLDDVAALDVSAGPVIVERRGPSARDVLASSCPLDLHPRAFEPGACAQSLIAKAPVLLSQTDAVELSPLPSSVARVVRRLLARRRHGRRINAFRADARDWSPPYTSRPL
jgi:sarcosine oxidase subunit gamma